MYTALRTLSKWYSSNKKTPPNDLDLSLINKTALNEKLLFYLPSEPGMYFVVALLQSYINITWEALT